MNDYYTTKGLMHHPLPFLSLPFSWVFGDFLCKMYQFVHSLSSTASIFILVVICMERYFAIIHPITCKQTLTSRRLRVSQKIPGYPSPNDYQQRQLEVAAEEDYREEGNCNVHSDEL